MSKSFIAASGTVLCRLAAYYKIDPAPLFNEAGLDINLMRDPNARYNSVALDLAWQSAADKIGNPCFGLKAADCWHPSDLHALGYAWLASKTLRTALGRLSRYARIVTDMDDFILHENEDILSVIIENRGLSPEILWAADITMAVLLSMCRFNYGDKLIPESVQFIHPEPDCASEYYRFFRCPVRFNARENRINLFKEDADLPLAGANAKLAQVNDQIMIEYLAQLDRNDVVQQVKSAIIRQLPSGNVTDSTVASSLYRNERTLQRQLRKEGTTFKTLLNEIRGELADKYIRDSHLSLTEVSFLLGFSEMSSFSRAFRRWTGKSPSLYRQHSLGTDK